MGQDQGASSVGFWGGLCPWLADSAFSVCPRGAFLLCMGGGGRERARESLFSRALRISSSSYKDTVLLDEGPTLRPWGLGLQLIMTLRKTQFSP